MSARFASMPRSSRWRTHQACPSRHVRLQLGSQKSNDICLSELPFLRIVDFVKLCQLSKPKPRPIRRRFLLPGVVYLRCSPRLIHGIPSRIEPKNTSVLLSTNLSSKRIHVNPIRVDFAVAPRDTEGISHHLSGSKRISGGSKRISIGFGAYSTRFGISS